MVIVFGSINLDLVARVAHIPTPGETIGACAFSTAPGGKGANQALAARDAGASVAMYGAVGNDSFAPEALANLDAAGVALDGVATVATATGIALINVDDRGENAITVVPGANAKARADAVPPHALAAGDTLLMQLEVPIAEIATLAERARASGVRVVLNAAPAVALPLSLLRCVDVLIVNESEATFYADLWKLQQVPESFISRMQEQFGVCTVLTLGARGALVSLDGQPSEVHPPAVAVVDTTGAGDAFAGALAAVLDRGDSLAAALVEALDAGARACTHRGAQRPRSADAPAKQLN